MFVFLFTFTKGHDYPFKVELNLNSTENSTMSPILKDTLEDISNNWVF